MATSHRHRSGPQDGPTAVLSRAAQRQPGQIALVSGGLAANAATLNARVALLAGVLAYLGLPRATRVGLALDGDPRQLEAALGVLRAGLTPVRLDAALPAGETLRLLRGLEVRVLIATPGALQRLRREDEVALQRLLVIAADRRLGGAHDALDYERALETAEASFHDAAGLPHDAAVLQALAEGERTRIERLSYRALDERIAAAAASFAPGQRVALSGLDLPRALAALAAGATLETATPRILEATAGPQLLTACA
jgi:hypothetical protein